jgi:GLPGLI family protein
MFERKENVHKAFQDTDRDWYESIKNRIPKYKIDVFELVFNTEQTVYELKQEDENKGMSWARVASDNKVTMSFPSLTYKQEKNVYDKTYLVQDSLQNINWKFSNEYREIAGFNCKRATTILYDSLYVIAFYTDQIPVSSGPETFNGLPGMILGIVIPKLHFTYFATQVNKAVVSPERFQTKWSKKIKHVSQDELMKEIELALKDWGKWGRAIYWKVMY